MAFGEERPDANSSLTVSGNTIIDDYGSNANVLLNPTDIPVSFTDNTLYGLDSGRFPPDRWSLAGDRYIRQPVQRTGACHAPLPGQPRLFRRRHPDMTDTGLQPIQALRIGQQVGVVGPGNDASAGQAVRRSSGSAIGISICRAMPGRPWFGRSASLPVRLRTICRCATSLVSPDHAIAVNGVLIQARLLHNGATIVRDDRLQHVQYFHLELDGMIWFWPKDSRPKAISTPATAPPSTTPIPCLFCIPTGPAASGRPGGKHCPDSVRRRCRTGGAGVAPAGHPGFRTGVYDQSAGDDLRSGAPPGDRWPRLLAGFVFRSASRLRSAAHGGGGSDQVPLDRSVRRNPLDRRPAPAWCGNRAHRVFRPGRCLRTPG